MVNAASCNGRREESGQERDWANDQDVSTQLQHKIPNCIAFDAFLL